MADLPLNRFREFVDLTEAELAALAALCGEPERLPARSVLHSQGDRVDRIYFLVSGWLASGVAVPQGVQQIFKIHLPGDMLGVPSMAVTRAAETLTALTPITVLPIQMEAFGELFTEQPRLAAVLFLCVQYERVALMDRLTSIGRSRSLSRLAAFFVHIYDRLHAIDARHPPTLDLPLTQAELADLVGITAVHVNRKLQELETTGLIARKRSRIELVDVDGLRRLADLPAHRLRRDYGWLRDNAADRA